MSVYPAGKGATGGIGAWEGESGTAGNGGMRYVGESPSAELLDDGARAVSVYMRGGRIGSEAPI